ncbi:MAG: hypothetical protein SVJ22_07975, partial [Halobacteriota archaeon]|nr:hypothetical protein [Halobacteriota archaeon]
MERIKGDKMNNVRNNRMNGNFLFLHKGKGRTSIIVAATILFMIFASTIQVSAQSAGEVQITINLSDQRTPRIYNDIIVWQDN